jgi:hypothetical protein
MEAEEEEEKSSAKALFFFFSLFFEGRGRRKTETREGAMQASDHSCVV